MLTFPARPSSWATIPAQVATAPTVNPNAGIPSPSTLGVPAGPTPPFIQFLHPQNAVPGMDQIWADIWPMPWRGPLDLDNFGSETAYMRRMYRALYLKEPALQAAIEGKIEAVASLDVTVNSGDEDDPHANAYAKFVDWTIRKTRDRWCGMIRSIGLGSLVDGWSFTEKTLKVIEPAESRLWAGRWGLKHTKTRDTEHLRLQLDQYRNVVGVVNTLRGAESFDIDKGILFAHATFLDNPFGRSDVRAAYRACNLIEAAYKLWAVLLQTQSGPYLKGSVKDQSRKAGMEAALARARGLGYIVIQDGDAIELLNLASAASFEAFEKKVRILREEIFFTVRGAYLPFLQGSGTGGETRGDASVGKTVGSDPKEYMLAQAIESALEMDLIPEFAVNFPPGTEQPTIELGGVDWKEMKDRLGLVNDARKEGKLETSKRWYRKTFQIPAPEGPDDILPPPDDGQQGPGAPGGPAGPGGPMGGPPGKPGGPDGKEPPQGPGGPDGGKPAPQVPPALPTNPQGNDAPATPKGPESVPDPDGVRNLRTAATQDEAPPELIAAMLEAQASGDTEAVQRLASLADDPEGLADAMADIQGGTAGSVGASALKQFAMRVKTFSAASAGVKWFAWVADPTARSKSRITHEESGRHAYGATARKILENQGKRDRGERVESGSQRAKRQKEEKEPLRAAGREVLARALKDPGSVPLHELSALAEHISVLTAAEARQHYESLGKRGVGRLKQELVDGLLDHVRSKGEEARGGDPFGMDAMYGVEGSGSPGALAGRTQEWDRLGDHLQQQQAKAAVARGGQGDRRPGEVREVPTNSLHVDPERFQYKMGTNKSGVTDKLKDVKVWNPDFAGVTATWVDPADGKEYVVNGHHRRELAGRLGVPTLATRRIEAKTAKEARAKGALINIAEGNGTAIDAAKFMRDMGLTREDFKDYGVSLKTGTLADQAEILVKLNDRAFDRLTRGNLDLQTALAVARHVTDPDRQERLFKLIEKKEEDGKEFTARTLDEMARAMAAAPSVKTTENTLWGVEENEEDTFIHRAELAAHVRGELAKELNDYTALASQRRADRTAGAGNVLAVDKNKELADEAEQAKNLYDTLVNRKGPIADALNEASVKMATAKKKKEKDDVRRATIAAVRAAIQLERDKLSGSSRAKPSTDPGPQEGTVSGSEGVSGAAAPAADAGAGSPELTAKADEPAAASPEPEPDSKSTAPAPGTVHDIPAFGNRMAIKAKFFPGRKDGEIGVGHADSNLPSTYMPAESANHFVNDLSGKADLPKTASGHPVVDDIARGRGEHLGKGDDGVVFGVGDKVAKMSTTVPYQPFNPGHRTPEQAAKQLEDQAETNNLLHSMGITGILPMETVRHGDKAFAIRDKLEMPDKLTPEQLDKVRRSLDQMHEAGYVVGDDIQVGLKGDEPYLFDLGKAQKARDDDDYHDDSDRWERFAEKMGQKDTLPLAKSAASRLDAMSATRELDPDYGKDGEEQKLQQAIAKSRGPAPAPAATPAPKPASPLSREHREAISSVFNQAGDVAFVGGVDPQHVADHAGAKPFDAGAAFEDALRKQADNVGADWQTVQDAVGSDDPQDKLNLKALSDLAWKDVTKQINDEPGRLVVHNADHLPKYGVENPLNEIPGAGFRDAGRPGESAIVVTDTLPLPDGRRRIAEGKKATATATANADQPPDRLSALNAIAPGESAWVDGHFVRRTADGRHQIETERGYHTGDAESVADKIRLNWQTQDADKGDVKRALDRVQAAGEPDGGWFGGNNDREATGRAGVPEGARAVSLDPNTEGRVGKVVRDPETGATRLHLGGDTHATDFEPLDEAYSWRGGEKKAAATPKPAAKTPGMFDSPIADRPKAMTPKSRNSLEKDYGFSVEEIDGMLSNGPSDKTWQEYKGDILKHDPKIAKEIFTAWAERSIGDLDRSPASGYRTPSPNDLNTDGIYLWHGTSVKGGEGIIKNGGLRTGDRGTNAAAKIEAAWQYPEDTGAQYMALIKADPKRLDVDVNDQEGETVEDGLFHGRSSSATVGKHQLAAVFDVRDASDEALNALQKGDFVKAMKLGAALVHAPKQTPAPADDGYTSEGLPFRGRGELAEDKLTAEHLPAIERRLSQMGDTSGLRAAADRENDPFKAAEMRGRADDADALRQKLQGARDRLGGDSPQTPSSTLDTP